MKKIITHQDGVKEFILENEYLKVHLINVGASIFKIIYKEVDVIVGPKDIDTFIKKDHYYGKTIGRFSGRLFTDKVFIDSKKIAMPSFKNEGTTIHGGPNGYSTKKFVYFDTSDKEVMFKLQAKEEDDFLPGDVDLTVKYVLDERDLTIFYEAISTKTTLLNITNHSYFNLSAEKTIENHTLSVEADKYVVFDEKFNVLGVETVKGTIFNLKEPIRLKKPLAVLKETQFQGFDTIYLLDDSKKINLASDLANIDLTITTSYPSLVVYTHNSQSPDNLEYFKLWPYAGIALECEYEPGGMFYPFLNDGIINKNEKYSHFIKYQFR